MAKSDNQARAGVLFLCPTPPPFAGTELGGKYLLESGLTTRVKLHHVRSNIRTNNMNREKINLEAIHSLFRIIWKCLQVLTYHDIHVIYFLVTSNNTGLLRDMVYFSLARLFGKRVVIHYKGSNYVKFYHSKNRFWQAIIRALLKSANRLLVESESIAKEFAILIPREKVSIVPPGIKLEHIAPITRDFSRRPVKLLYFGNLSYAKGLHQLSQAFIQLSQRIPELELHLAGELLLNETAFQWLTGEHERYYRDHYVEINRYLNEFITDNRQKGVFYHGRLDSVGIYRLLVDCDILVFLSFSEGFSVTILESLTFGLPMIITRVGAAKDFLIDGVHCFFVEPGDCDSVCRKLELLMHDPELMCQMSHNNQSLVRDKFDVEVVAASLAMVFDEIVGNSTTSDKR
jgi:glycosyltransferase involved in cell wall biosynthesis